MKTNSKILGILFVVTSLTTVVNAQNTVTVGGEKMYASKDIIDNAVNSKDHTTLVAAVKAADLVATLKTKGPFTVFAPVNSAFDALPKGTVETLLKPENKEKLAGVLTYHVVAGKYDLAVLKDLIKKRKRKSHINFSSRTSINFYEQWSIKHTSG
jgi:uncharacterized surface protein with fasciclin (FAS1) repeats